MDIKRFFMALPAVATMLLAASCSNQEIENIEATQTPEKHSIPFEAVVNSPAQTRGTLNDAGDTYVFQAGDKLFVLEDAASPTIMAELTLNPEDAGKTTGARFTGTLDYTGDEPTSTTPVVAWLKGANDLLLPATVAELADAGGEVTFPKSAIVASPADAVEKYSYFFSTTPATYSTPTFTLNQLSSFIDFNIALEDGTAAGDVGVSITNGGAEVRSGTVAAADDGFGGLVAHFTAAFMGSGWGYFAAATTLSSATVTLGTKSPISFGGTTELAPNKIYQVSKGYYEAGAKYTLTAEAGGNSEELPDQTLPINTTLEALLGTYAPYASVIQNAVVTSGENVTLGTFSKGTTPVSVTKSGTSEITVTIPMVGNVIFTITVTKQAAPAAASLSELKTAINGGTDCSSYIGWEVNSAGAIAASSISGTKIGYVAYVSTSDVDAGVSGSRILVLASADADQLVWGNGLKYVSGDGMNGYSYTNSMKDGCCPSAGAAWAYSATIPNGGATPAQWFMPSRMQWECMRDTQSGADNQAKRNAMNTAFGLLNADYWSSTEVDDTYAYRFSSIGKTDGYYKNAAFRIRACFAY